MANQTPDGKLIFWYQGETTTLIKSTSAAQVGNATYWYNGSPQGFLLDSFSTIKLRNFAVLVGF